MAALKREKDLDSEQAEEVYPAENMEQREEAVELVTEQISRVSVSEAPPTVSPATDTVETTRPESSSLDLDKKIRALKKKIRLAEAQQQDEQQSMKPEQTEKMKKVEGWREELKLLEDRKAKLDS